MTKQRWLLLSAVLMIAVALAGCGGADNNSGDGTDAGTNAGADAGANNGATGGANGGGDSDNDGVVAADAEAIYTQNCVTCHGADLKGKLGPNTNISAVGGRLSQDEINTVLTNGRNGMPAFKNQLTTEEIDTLAAWLSAKQ